VWQCVAECDGVLQCVAMGTFGIMYCSVLQCVALCGSVLQRIAVCCRLLQVVAVCCSVLLLAYSYHDSFPERALSLLGKSALYLLDRQKSIGYFMQKEPHFCRASYIVCVSPMGGVAVGCCVLQWVVVCCSVLQRVALCCSVMQFVAV